jgi:tRNA 2-thiouridine synthesizing protein A
MEPEMGEKTLNPRGLKSLLRVFRTQKVLFSLPAAPILFMECTDPLASVDITNLLRQTGGALEETSRALE